MIKRNCFAYLNGNCKALRQLYCETEECCFYKPHDGEYTDEEELARYRDLGSLDYLTAVKTLYEAPSFWKKPQIEGENRKRSSAKGALNGKQI